MEYDIVIVGGGHAGIEAANSAAKYGLSVLIITASIDFIGQMPCNPSIGGIAKGTIVREIDALGGLMGSVIDKTGIQFRMLNKSKGAAVWGNRAQADKYQYRELCRAIIESIPNISIFQDMVTGIKVKDKKICGIYTESGEFIQSKAVILTMGTFLNGLAHIGLNSFECGRSGERSSRFLSESIQKEGIHVGRLKTGTPARIDGRSIDYSEMVEQEGDREPWPFSFSTENKVKNKICCWEVKTTNKTHQIIRDNIHLSPVYSGKIRGVGPRYCPSIEDKVVRFGDRNGHTLFLEPEGLNTHEMYLNGFSTSLPYNIQVLMIQSIPGFSNAKIIRPAYAIEYDYFYPEQLRETLESRKIRNLFFAGQINGTSGYEEAACQGLVAGVNAARKVIDKETLILSRDSSYTGVLIDDLITKGTEEPYRMFTSRAEYRLLLRQDNADERLMPLALQLGLITATQYNKRKIIWESRKNIIEKLKNSFLEPSTLSQVLPSIKIDKKISAFDLLKRPKILLKDIEKLIVIENLDIQKRVTIEADIKYNGFILKQKKEIEKLKKEEQTPIPDTINYRLIHGLLHDSVNKLKKIQPLTLGQASRIAGITPADISAIIRYITKKK